MTAERLFLNQIFANVFQGTPTKPVWEWADENVVFSAKESAESPRFDSSLTPWTRDFQDIIRDPATHEAIFLKSSRTGVTEAALNVLRYMPKHFPGNALFCINSEKKAQDVSKKRLRHHIQTHGAEQLTGNPHDISTYTMALQNMVIKVAGSGSPSPFREEWYRVAILDEVEDHEELPDGNSYDLVRSRFTTVSDATLFVLGKPQEEGGIIHRTYTRGTQEKWMVPCPRCNERIELTFDNLVFDHCRDLVGGWDLNAVLKTTYYRCQHCGGKIEEWEKRQMVAQGEWQPTPEKHRMKYERKPVPPVPGVRSFHINDLYSPFPKVSWGILAEKWIVATSITPSEAARDDFRKNHLGLPVAPKVMHVAAETIEALRAGRVEVEEYQDGVDLISGEPIIKTRRVTHGEEFDLCYDPETGEYLNPLPDHFQTTEPILTIAADKQGEAGGYLKYVVFAWASDGQSWLVDYGTCQDEYALTTLKDRPYFIKGQNQPRFIYGGGIDCRYRPHEVYAACLKAQREGWRLYPIRGDGRDLELRGKTYDEKIDYTKGGQVVQIYRFHNPTIMSDFYLGKVQRREHPRFWLPTVNGTVPEPIAAELTAEKLETYHIGGQTKQRWVHSREKDGPNDYGDCCKIQHGIIWPLLSAALQK